MGRRPEPCILFAQTFIHSQLDEYVDEVLFAEPIVVTACEFLEQNASLSTPSISLLGATSPPSFAMEVFVHCEGESRFRRLCQPFLYSHSSSNVLEVEAVITNHLVVRGCYRSLTLIIYGNTAEDLGQFNIDLDLDNSLVSLAPSPAEGKLEDLPPALLSEKPTFEESILYPKCLSLPVSDLDLSPAMMQFLRLSLNICLISDDLEVMYKVTRSIVSAVCSYVTSENLSTISNEDQLHASLVDREKDSRKVISVLSEARNELLSLYNSLQVLSGNKQLAAEDIILEPEVDLVTSQLIVDMLFRCFPVLLKTTFTEVHPLLQNKNLVLGLNMVLLVCSAKESCFHFVRCGGMDQIVSMLGHSSHRSAALTLVLLGAVENATQHAIGCEGFLGWWPRGEANVPTGNSDGYSNLVRLLFIKQRHDVASLATYVLQRLRFYETASRYESAVLSALAKSSSDDELPAEEVLHLFTAASELKQLVKLLNLSGPIEDPSPAALTRRLVPPVSSDGLLSYRSTVSCISLSKYSFSKWDIDTHLLSLLMESGFIPLSAALLSSPLLHSATGSTNEIFVEIAASIQSLLLSLLSCRSGLTFLMLQPEATATLLLSLRGTEDIRGTEDRSIVECLTLRQAAVLMSKGFFCHPQEIAMITEIHLRVGNAIDRLLTTPPNTDDLLWVLWDLCTISRSECGCEALLCLCYFPEALSVLMEALRSFKDLEILNTEDGTSPLNLASFHSAAEIFEVMVTDSTALSLNSWIGHAVELHKSLHLSSPGSNRKDAPTRLLEWIDAGVVYHKNGAIGLLRYAAVLAAGGDAHLTSTSVLVSESMDVENVVGDSTNGAEGQIFDALLGKLASDKYFEGLTLCDSSIVQLTTAIRILAFMSENSAMAASLFEEGAVTLVYVVLINCKYMLEQLSNTYDYLVDEGAESNSTSEILLDRNQEQKLVDLMIPSLLLLINLLKKIHEAKPKDPYRNKKLVNVLLRLHREVSPKVAACATDYSSSYPSLVLGFGAVCHLIASSLAYWVLFNWSPGLFHCLLESVPATPSLALGPKEACSMLHLLGDLLPEEGVWLWCNGMPPLCALRTLSIGTILGPGAEAYIDWFLHPEHLATMLLRLTFQLGRIGQILLNFAFSTLVVIQDMLRVFIIRIACQIPDYADRLLQPLISWIKDHMNETSLSEIDSFKVYRLLTFLASLSEHPRGKVVLLKADVIRIFASALKRCNDAYKFEGKPSQDDRTSGRSGSSVLSWTIPLFKSLALIFESQTSVQYSEKFDTDSSEEIHNGATATIGYQLLNSCQVLPVGKELLLCLVALKEFTLSSESQPALTYIFNEFKASLLKEHGADETDNSLSAVYDWRQFPPYLCCWRKLLRSLDSKDDSSAYAIEALYALCLSALCLCTGHESLEGVKMVKCLFGLRYDHNAATSLDGMEKEVLELVTLLDHRATEDGLLSNKKISLLQVKESVHRLLMLLQGPPVSSSTSKDLTSSEVSRLGERTAMTSQLVPPVTTFSLDDEITFSHIWDVNENIERDNKTFPFRGLIDKFMWECPDTLPDRLMPSLSGKRKMASSETSGKRVRESPVSEVVASNAFSRGLSTPAISSGLSRRDTFRHRKPNTSRPPSMHVDDYVARERNIDCASSGSHVVSSSQRGGSTSGRPPSVHVDEFEARQRERQNPTFVTVGSAAQAKRPTHESHTGPDKSDKPRQLKADLDDDHEIDIIFDEESGSDDRLPFPQPDDNLQSASVVVGENSPGSVVEETEGNAIEDALVSEDVNSHTEDALKKSDAQYDTPKETSTSSEKNYPVTSTNKTFPRHSDEPKFVLPKGPEHPRGNINPLPSHSLNINSAPSVKHPPLPIFYRRRSPQKDVKGSGSQGYHEHKFPTSQPPLPPMPPPSIPVMSPQMTESMPGQSPNYIQRDTQPPLFSGYPFQGFGATNTMHVQSDNLSSAVDSSLVPHANSQPILDSKYPWNTDFSSNRLHVENRSSVGSRPLAPPLPSTPPPFSSPMAQLSSSNSGPHSSLHAQVVNSGGQLSSLPTSIDSQLGIFSVSGPSLTSFSLPSFTPSPLINRASASGNQFESSTQHGQIQSSISQSIPSPQLSMHSVQPPPLPPPPQPPRPPHPFHNLSIPIQMSQFEQMLPIQQHSVQFQMQQQLRIPQIQLLYQPHQQEHIPQPSQPLPEQAHQKMESDSMNQQQNDPGMTLQQFFASPEAIQSLLSDRDKLCQLLEQHPKLMQMLQERLGQM